VAKEKENNPRHEFHELTRIKEKQRKEFVAFVAESDQVN